MKKQKIQFSKEKKVVGNMDVVLYKFAGEDVEKITETYQLSEEKQKEAIDKILNAHPNYLDLPQEEQYGLIASTMTLETIVFWLIATRKVKGKPNMYNAYMDTGDIATIEFFYVKNKKNAKKIEDAFKYKNTNVIPFPNKKISGKKKKDGPATIHTLNEDETDD